MFHWIHSVTPCIYRWAVHNSQWQGTARWVKTRQRMNTKHSSSVLLAAVSSLLTFWPSSAAAATGCKPLQSYPDLMSVRLSIVYLVDLRFFRRSKCKNIHKLTLEIVHRSFVTNVVPALVYNSPLFNIKCTLAQLVFLLPLPLFYNHVTHILPMISKIAPLLSQYFLHADLLALHYRIRSTARTGVLRVLLAWVYRVSWMHFKAQQIKTPPSWAVVKT